MKIDQNKKHYYYTGGFAEIVSAPSILTYSFFAQWFTGKTALGKAMDLLGLPYEQVEKSVLEISDGDLVVNLKTEEQTLYAKTVFSYKAQKHIHDMPILSVNPKKLLKPGYVIRTSSIAYKQGQWLAHPESTTEFIKQKVTSIPDPEVTNDLETYDSTLQEKVWPVVIAAGTLSEFFTQVIAKEYAAHHIQHYVSGKVAERDWFFRSLADMQLVKRKTVSFTEYLTRYGLRSDKDYELTAPRWHEIPEVIKKRISSFDPAPAPEQTFDLPAKVNTDKRITAAIELQIIRSEAKKKALLHIDALRRTVLQKAKLMNVHAERITRDVLYGRKQRMNNTNTTQKHQPQLTIHHKRFGSGVRVSIGKATGTALHVTDIAADIPPNTIGIFPNASPEFAMQYPRCQGMIFLKGGQTSHGAIVAREFGIPAIIAHEAAVIKNGAIVTISGDKGEWQLE
jgi:phosphohistidine swiveling domain-containing protein